MFELEGDKRGGETPTRELGRGVSKSTLEIDELIYFVNINFEIYL